MCGLVGWFNLDVSGAECQPLLRKMCSQIVHRGPDDQGFYSDEMVGLGFQRLSILDLKDGHQPMASVNDDVIIVFNGEIFNHQELRIKLEKKGVKFLTHSDTEIILQLYIAQGISAISSLNGMFSIVIWDKRKSQIHLVRDRLGVKPLYYARFGKGIIFASEVKAILGSGLITKSINPQSIWDYLTYRYVPSPNTMWEKIYKLPPAHRIEISVGGPNNSPIRWWDMHMQSPSMEQCDSLYETEFEKLFEDSVQLRLQADVPVGIMLSGGLDSSAIVAAAAAAGSENLKTFSVAFEDSLDSNELDYAKLVSNKFSTNHYEVLVSEKEFIDFLPDFTWYSDEPLADLACVPLYYLSRLASSEVKVVLSGEGADEVFGGYDFDRCVRQWDAAIPAGSYSLKHFFSHLFDVKSSTSHINDQRKAIEPIAMTNLWSTSEKNEIMHQQNCMPDSMDTIRNQLLRVGNQDPLNQVLYTYCQDWLVEDLLMKADKMSMANSLELRTPFLDYRLVEWSAKLPVRLKVGKSPDGVMRTKEILRRYADKHLSSEVVNRPKQGFPVPVYGWLDNKLKKWASDLLLDSHAHIHGWLKREKIEGIVHRGTSSDGSMKDRHRVWSLLILEIWMRRWING